MPPFADLDAYFKRTGYAGSRAPCLRTLHALTRAHAQAIPFENMDVLLRRPVSLDPAVVFDKLVVQRRGGYCFEQNGLLLQVLRQLGFQARALGARVRLQISDRAILPRRTHMLIAVALDDACWLTDVGVGTASLTQALRLVPDVVQRTPHDARRLVREGRQWFQQIKRDGQWLDVCQFTLDDFPFVDRDVANWYTSTHPASSFRHELMVALARPDGGRSTLLNGQLTFHDRDGHRDARAVRTPAELSDALRQFNIALAPGDLQQLAQRLNLDPAAGPGHQRRHNG